MLFWGKSIKIFLFSVHSYEIIVCRKECCFIEMFVVVLHNLIADDKKYNCGEVDELDQKLVLK